MDLLAGLIRQMAASRVGEPPDARPADFHRFDQRRLFVFKPREVFVRDLL